MLIAKMAGDVSEKDFEDELQDDDHLKFQLSEKFKNRKSFR